MPDQDQARTLAGGPLKDLLDWLKLPGTDYSVSVPSHLQQHAPGVPLAGWVPDENAAFRQVATRPSHRRYAVIAMWAPSSLESPTL